MAGVLMCLATTAPANDVNVGMCMVVVSGVHTAATERQAGTSKNNAQKILEADLQKVAQTFSDKMFVKFVEESWFKGLDVVYNLPIQSEDDKKAQFITETTRASFEVCLTNLGV